MKQTSSKLSLSAATLFTFVFVMAAPGARADDYCITNGAQAAHGCGYPSMETCRAAAAGIGGMCSQSASSSSNSPSDAMAKAHHHRRSKLHKNQSAGS
jgi:hypothetical protein